METTQEGLVATRDLICILNYEQLIKFRREIRAIYTPSFPIYPNGSLRVNRNLLLKAIEIEIRKKLR